MRMILTEDIANEIVAYLGKQPFQDVFQLVQKIGNLEKVEEKKLE